MVARAAAEVKEGILAARLSRENIHQFLRKAEAARSR